MGLSGVDHPVLGAGVCLGDEQGWVFSGRISLAVFPWLADHTVGDVVVVPGAAVVEMVLAAGACAGVGWLEELVLHAPVLVSEQQAVAVQVLIGAAGGDGRCAVGVFARGDSEQVDAGWVRHGSAVMRAAAEAPVAAVGGVGGVAAGGCGGGGGGVVV